MRTFSVRVYNALPTERKGECVTLGVPFARGELKDAALLRVSAGDGTELPAQARDEYLKAEVSWLAGALTAQSILLPPPLDSGIAGSDFENACNCCEHLIGPKCASEEWVRALNAILRQATLRAEEIISEHREATLALASQSVSSSALSGRSIIEILTSHGVKRHVNEWGCLSLNDA